MYEIIFTTVAGLVVGYIIKHQLCPRHINQLEGSLKIQSEKINTENQRLIKENNILKDPKRLIKEYEGGEGSLTGELRQTMRKNIELLEQREGTLRASNQTLMNKERELSSRVEELERKLNSELQDEYDSAIDFLNKQLDKARTLGATGTKHTITKLEKKREEIDKKNKDK